MLKKIVLFVGLILSPSIFALEFMQCNFDSELGGGNDERISEIRERAFDSCLKCEGSSCKMLLYPPESDPAKFCKRVFCTPKKIRKIQAEEIPRDLGIGKSRFEFSYKITEKGRVRDVKIVSLQGAMNERDAYRWTIGLTKRVTYLPIEIKGKTYEITNLSAVLFVNTGAFEGS